jgi:hypothetical protein
MMRHPDIAAAERARRITGAWLIVAAIASVFVGQMAVTGIEQLAADAVEQEQSQ